MKKPDGQWWLVFRSASHASEFNVPAGVPCLLVNNQDRGILKTYPEAIPIGRLTYGDGGPMPEATDEFLMNLLGYNITTSSVSDPLHNWERANDVSSLFLCFSSRSI